MIQKDKSCLLCNSVELKKFDSLELTSTSSDDKPLDYLFDIYICLECGHIQKLNNKKWQDIVNSIYDNYEIYRASNGCENIVFSGLGNSSRSQKIIENLQEEVEEFGTVLDFGCGNGAFLKSFSNAYPKWDLTGYDFNTRYENEILNIKNVKEFSHSNLDKYKESFNLIVSNFVFEHLTTPKEILVQLIRALKKEGCLIITVPDFSENPFDLTVVDHCSHFTMESLKFLCSHVNCEIVNVDKLINRTLTITIKKRENLSDLNHINTKVLYDNINYQLEWLNKIVEEIKEISLTEDNLVIFGTGTASAWISGYISKNIKYYLDESIEKIGNDFLGKKIIGINKLDIKDVIYISLPYDLANKIKNKIKNKKSGLKIKIPPILNLGE